MGSEMCIRDRHSTALNFIQTADATVKKAEALKDAIDNKDFATAADLASSLSEDISGHALPEQLGNAASLIDAVQSGDVSGSSALLRELTQGKHSHIIDVFESVGTATSQFKLLETAIEKENFGEASGIAESLAQQVIGKDNSISDTLSRFGDVLAGKVLVRLDGMPGMTPGINPGATGAAGDSGMVGGFAAPTFQPMMANGFGATSASGQTAVAQAGQLAFSATSTAQTVELSPAEQSALERIERNLAQGLFNDVNQAELQEISQVLSKLTPVQKNNVISKLSDEKLETWGNEIDGWNGSLSTSEKADLSDGLARDLESTQLVRVLSLIHI